MWITEKHPISCANDVIVFLKQLREKYPDKKIKPIDVQIDVDSWSDYGVDGFYTVNNVIATYVFWKPPTNE
jgi:hypothetical protein